MTIFPWAQLQLSVINSNAITLDRLPREPYRDSQDAYFAVVLLSGDYCLSQDGREVFLRPGDMTLYDATRLHRIQCPRPFRKLIVSVPRPLLRSHVAGVEHCTALRIPGSEGIGAVVSDFVRSIASHAQSLPACEFSALAAHGFDLLARAVSAVCPAGASRARSRSVSISHIKGYLESRIGDASLDSRTVAREIGLSSRYINSLFEGEGTSLMRYLWQRRLTLVRLDLQDSRHSGLRIAEIASRRGFADPSHFGRAYKRRFGEPPRASRNSIVGG
jgi:AraC-like DNA-binding protein